MTTQTLGSGPTHPSGPAGPGPGNPRPPEPPRPTAPPSPPPRNHLVDSGWKIELLDGDYALLAVARVNDAGVWWLSQRGHEAVYVGGRFGAESVMHELVVT